MRKTIEVVDDFYRDPHVRRERLLAQGKTASEGSVGLDVETRTRLAGLLGCAEGSLPEVTGRLPLVLAPGETGAAPHTYDSVWAALVCLALPEARFPSVIRFYRPAVASSDNAPAECWEETAYVPLTFNRMVLFHGAVAHRYSVGDIDRGPEGDRTTQMFLLDEPDGRR
ncbi:hypothetical protein [Pseudonocardia sp. HH130630-07]|uniref:hypothetical protein n=1 Tax=Pseudonocardia sp. HH130630-07 TaxID=1690815 RepID=UPI000814FF6C|nr:hypothetical protein [Pseudonocardia sp. HH130630-07]ANY05783.1 hypothetical protein AFB00_05110 [Pseudonocardia sp. HH130630-07]